MTASPIYEQISAARPGEPFQPSGLYRFCGMATETRFVPATGHRPLRTMAEWLAVERPVMPEASPAPPPAALVSAAPPAPRERAPALPAPRQTVAAPTDMLGKAVALQVQWGWRAPAVQPVRTLEQAPPCARCGQAECGCPPPPPKVLDAAAAANGWPSFPTRKG